MTQTATPTPTRKQRKPAQGKVLEHLLRQRGVNVSSVVQNQKTKVYTLRFYAANPSDMSAEGTAPLSTWKRRVREAVPEIEIISGIENIAEWRVAKTRLSVVIFATWNAAGAR